MRLDEPARGNMIIICTKKTCHRVQGMYVGLERGASFSKYVGHSVFPKHVCDVLTSCKFAVGSRQHSLS